nr:hypothetical protein Iba_chr08dCG13650 [Ipomoea batatas]GME08448.1 hypothetical protein Iba_scaffold7622CG0070 [Ipomoea batatas]GME15013.1 hypothetical protein Iba_scaffold15754CG0030 [Ipomoea batatas]
MGAEAEDAKSANLKGGFAGELGSVGFRFVAMRERVKVVQFGRELVLVVGLRASEIRICNTRKM